MKKLLKKTDLNRFKKQIKADKFEIILLLLIISLAVFVRFYRINELHYFVYDQARDALYIKRMIVDHKLRLIGTQSSIPGLYTGPAYYYLMVPFLWIFGLNPVGIDFAVALVGVLTVFLLYYLVKILTKNSFSALLVAGLYALQPQIVAQSRFAWNPNLTPFFFLLFLIGFYQVIQAKSWGWILTFFSLAILLQLHYSAMMLVPVLILFVIVNLKKIKFDRLFFLSIFIFIMIMSPLLFFDLRHDFINLKAVLGYLKRGAPGEIPPPPLLSGLVSKAEFLLFELPLGLKSFPFSWLALLVVFFFPVFFSIKRQKENQGLVLVILSLGIGLLGASLYRGGFFSFYLTPFYPIGFLLIGILISELVSRKSFLKWLVFFLLTVVFITNFNKTLNRLKSERPIENLDRVAKIIANDADKSIPFNLVGLRGGDRFDRNAVDYRYYLETFYQVRSLDWDVLDYQNSEIVYLISHFGEIDPLKQNAWELELYGPKEIIQTWELTNDVVIYKLGK